MLPELLSKIFRSPLTFIQQFLTINYTPFKIKFFPLFPGLSYKFFRLSLITVVSVLLIQGIWQPSHAQLPDPLNPPNQTERFSLGIQSNQGGTIGNLHYTAVRIDGEPLFFIAVPGNSSTETDQKDSLSPVKHRQKSIESTLQEIIERGFDPETLTVTTPTLNNLKVVQISDGKNLRPKILRTITSADAQLYAQSVEDLAQETVTVVKTALQKAWQERQPPAIQQQVLKATITLGIMAMMTLFFLLIYRWLGHRIRLLKTALESLIKAQAAQTDQDPTIDIEIFADLYQSRLQYPPIFRYCDRATLLLYYLCERFKRLFVGDSGDDKNSKAHSSIYSFTILLDSQSILSSILESHTKESFNLFLRNRLKQVFFARRLAFYLCFLVWIRGTALIFQLFPDTRWLGRQVAGTPISLILIWFFVLILIKMTDYFIDHFFRILQEDFTLVNETHYSRQYIRAHTISGALRGSNIVLCVFGGLVASLSLFNIPITTILAGAGILGFAISFGSQSIIKDLIAGISNLINDSFAVDDFVEIGAFSGKVEKMNLFVTRVRCANGDLVTIPNGTISTVCNQTKDWSRVDFLIMVAADTNLKAAIAILQRVALGLYHDPFWRPKMLAVPEFKGVEEFSHQGIQLRIWLKTLPGEQWDVARELRLRVKGTFDTENIAIGIPQQKWVMSTAPVADEGDLSVETARID